MAFEKKPLQDGVKTKLKDYSVDLEDRIGNIDKTDIGLGNVVNVKQAQIINSDGTNSTVDIPIGTYGVYLVVGTWEGARRYAFIAGREVGNANFFNLVDPLNATISRNGTTFKTGDTFTLDRSVLKKGHLQLQPIAYKGDKVKKWKIITLEVQSSLNVLEDTTSIEISVAQDLYDLIDTKQDKIKTKGNPTWENLGLLLKELIE